MTTGMRQMFPSEVANLSRNGENSFRIAFCSAKYRELCFVERRYVTTQDNPRLPGSGQATGSRNNGARFDQRLPGAQEA
jgi:hypothetical protein